MGQSRNRKGIDFEIDRSKERGWKRTPKSPKIKWSGEGKTNWDKIKSAVTNPSKFKPIIELSKFNKYDSVTKDNKRIELKKINKNKLNKWQLYSEPIFCVKNWSDIPKILDIFGSITDVSHITKENVKDYKDDLVKIVKEMSTDGFNYFLSNVIKNVGDDIIDRVVGTSEGVEVIDGFIPREHLEFRWATRKGWLGFNRYVIEFRIKQTNDITLNMKNEVYKLIESISDKTSFIEDLIVKYYNKKNNI